MAGGDGEHATLDGEMEGGDGEMEGDEGGEMEGCDWAPVIFFLTPSFAKRVAMRRNRRLRLLDYYKMRPPNITFYSLFKQKDIKCPIRHSSEYIEIKANYN
jgi:hypothetical protein